MSGSPVQERPTSPSHRFLAGAIAILAFVATVAFTLVQDIEHLPPVWRTGLTALGLCIGTYFTLWVTRPNWFGPIVKIGCLLATVAIVTGAAIFLTPKPPTAPERLLG